MKSKVTGLIAVALITIFVIGCPKKQVVKVITPGIEATAPLPLAEIIVFKGPDVPLSESRYNETFGEHVGLGGSIILTAQGIDLNGKRVKISPVWTADPEVFQITPSQGATVTVKSIAKRAIFTTKIIIEADGVKKELMMSTY